MGHGRHFIPSRKFMKAEGDPLAPVEFLTEKGYPALGLEPMM